MTDIQSFHLYIGTYANQANVFSEISNSDRELHIIESGNTSDSIGNTLSPQQLQTLEDQGRTIIGYVNLAVPDANRSYWDDSWVTPSAADPTDLDYGTINPNAPAWLQNHLSVATGPETGGDGNYGYIVDYRDEDWQQIVVDQAVELMEFGYDGLFLDDLGRYYSAFVDSALTIEEAANGLMALVNRVAFEALMINPQAYLVVNGGAYLGWDSGGGAIWEQFREYTDALMMENQYLESTDRDANDPWGAAQTNFGPTTNPDGIDYLSVEGAYNLPDAQAEADYETWGDTNGILTFVAVTDAYNTRPEAGTFTDGDLPPPTNQTGDGTDEIILGTTGEDTLSGMGGADTIFGGESADAIDGGPGDDTIMPGTGADGVTLGAGADTVIGHLSHFNETEIFDFTGEDKIVFYHSYLTGQHITSVTPVETNGDVTAKFLTIERGSLGTAQMKIGADFEQGDVMLAYDGTDTVMTFETLLPALVETQSIAPGLVNGIMNQAFLSGDAPHEFSVTIGQQSFTGKDNLVGVYVVGTDGTIGQVRLISADVMDDRGELMSLPRIDPGESLGFFLVADGGHLVDGGPLPQGGLTFEHTGGGSANVANGTDIVFKVNGAAVTEHVYHSYDMSMNADGVQHVLSGVDPTTGGLIIGFEDIYGGGDLDYQDVILNIGIMGID